ADPAPAGPSARPYRPRGSGPATRTPCPAPSPTRRRHPPGARLIRPRSPPATASAPVCVDPACGRRSRAHRIVTETQDQVILLTFVLVTGLVLDRRYGVARGWRRPAVRPLVIVRSVSA